MLVVAAEVRAGLIPNEVLTCPQMKIALIHHAGASEGTLYVEVVVPRTLTHAFLNPEHRKAAMLELFKQLRDDMNHFLHTYHAEVSG